VSTAEEASKAASASPAAPGRPSRYLRIGRVLPWLLAVAALSFVAWMIPVRDRCWDPRAPQSTRVAVSRSEVGCVLHLRSGDVSVDASQCADLQCEPGIVSTFAHARVGVLAGLLAVYGLGTLAWAARWRALLSFAGIDLPLSKVWRISIEAQAGGILLPGGLGGDALRTASVVARPTIPGEARSPASIVVASVLLDRAVGLSLIAGVAALLGVASGGVQAGPLVVALGSIPVAVLLGLVVLRRAPPALVGRMAKGRGGSVVGPVLAYIRDPRAPGAIAVAAALSVVVAIVQFAVIRGLVFALGAVPIEEKWVYVGTAMAFIVSAIPALPGGWGTADAAYVFFFGLGGIGSGVALAVCLLFRLFWYVCGVVGAILRVARREGAGAASLYGG
jgi:glycosyltransferase 2 family protein